MAWDLWNAVVIARMGMAWDTGPPVWPYETAWMALAALNAPVWALIAPLLSLAGIVFLPLRHALLLPPIVVWWWWLGRHLDRGLFPNRRRRRSWLAAAGRALPAVGCYAVAAMILVDTRARTTAAMLLSAGPVLWLLAVAAVLTTRAIRILMAANMPQPSCPGKPAGDG